MLELKNITKRYGKKTALSDINIRFEHGIYGLLGPNGAGKSTMMNLMADILTPTAGEILYGGQSVKKLGDGYRAHIGFLPQRAGYYAQFTAEDTLRYFALLRGVAKAEIPERIDQVLQEVHLIKNKKDKVKTFSGGMKQRLGIAITLVGAPDILIFDEPTVGLDPKERIQFREVLQRLSENSTIILSTHIVSDVANIADYVVLMKDGKMVGFDTQEKILNEMLKGEKEADLEAIYMEIYGD